MKVVIRLKYEARNAIGNWNRRAALMVASLMTPVAVMAWALGGWRLAADLKWAGQFAIGSGFFSHWQVWFALAIAVQLAALLLHRYAQTVPVEKGAVHGESSSRAA